MDAHFERHFCIECGLCICACRECTSLGMCCCPDCPDEEIGPIHTCECPSTLILLGED